MAKPPAPPASPKKQDDLPENQVRVKHKASGRELVVNKAYLEAHLDTLEAV